MNRINVNDASREELIAIVRQLHQQVTRQRQQAAAGGAGAVDNDELIELRARLGASTDQVKLLRRELSEKNNEIRALTEQNVLLSKKSAGDEETINVLIKQLEEVQIRMSASEAAVVEHKQADENESSFMAMQKASTPRSSSSMEQQSHQRRPSLPPNTTTTTTTTASTGESSQTHSGFVATVTGTPVSKAVPGMTAVTARGRVESEGSTATATAKASIPSAVDVNRVASMSAALERKKEEIALLKEKVRELEEVNSLYTAIVLQHDEEEKNRLLEFKKAMKLDGSESEGGCGGRGVSEKGGLEYSETHAGSSANVGGVEEGILASAQWLQQTQNLQHALTKMEERNEHLERECADLRTMLRQSEREVAVRTQSVETMQADMIRLQLELVALERWVAAHKDDFVGGDHSRQFTTDDDERTVRSSSVQMEAGKATMSPSRAAGGEETMPRVGDRTRAQVMYSRQRAASTAASAITLPTTRDILNMAALPAITIRNPTRNETKLIARIELLEDHVRQTEAFEEDRQRSFNDMEKYRAEMFVNMNSELEKQRKEIQRLAQEKAQLEKLAAAAKASTGSATAAPGTTEADDANSLDAQEPAETREATHDAHLSSSLPQREVAADRSEEQTTKLAAEPARNEDKDETLLRELETGQGEHTHAHSAEDVSGAATATSTQRAPLMEAASEAKKEDTQADMADAETSFLNAMEVNRVAEELRTALEKSRQELAAAKQSEERLLAEKTEREGRVRNIVAAVGELRKKEKDSALQIMELEEQLRTACVISEQSTLEQSKGTWDFDSLLEAYGELLGAYMTLVASGTARCLDLDELTERNVSDLDAIMRVVQNNSNNNTNCIGNRKPGAMVYPDSSDVRLGSHSSTLSAGSHNRSSYTSSTRYPNDSTHTTVMRNGEYQSPTSYQYPAHYGDLASSGLGSGEYSNHSYEAPGGSVGGSPIVQPSAGVSPSPTAHGYTASQPQPMPYLAPSVGMMQSAQYTRPPYMMHHQQHQQQQQQAYAVPAAQHHHYEVNDYDHPVMAPVQKNSQNAQVPSPNVFDSLFGGYYGQPQQAQSTASGAQNASYASSPPPSTSYSYNQNSSSGNAKSGGGGGGGKDAFQAAFDPFA